MALLIADNDDGIPAGHESHDGSEGVCVPRQRILLAFDFDYTMIENNSDTYIRRLLPDQGFPQSLNKIIKESGWTVYMQAIFKHLHESKIDSCNINRFLQTMMLSPGIDSLLNQSLKPFIDCIIISDSNTYFIEEILTHHGLFSIFDKVYTNPASFLDNGLLKIEAFEHQTTCNQCAVNLCKGSVITDYIHERQRIGVNYLHIGYIGDGRNDFCPSYCLKEQDAVFPRVGYALLPYIEKMKTEKGLCLSAPVHPWTNAESILEVVSTWIKEWESMDEQSVEPVLPRLNCIPKKAPN